MENNNDIQKEMPEISPVISQTGNGNIYSVPVSYFNDLASEIFLKIQSGAGPSYYFSTRNPYSVPATYFEQFSEIILQKVKSSQTEVLSEISAIAPVLSTIDKRNVYAVPENYFQSLILPAAQESKPAAKVLSIKKPVKKLAKYAAAAIFTGLLAIGSYRIIEKDKINSGSEASTSVEVKNLSEDDIMNFLKTQSPEGVTSASYNINGQDDLRKSFSEIPDKDIQQFLQENGEGEDI